MQFVAIDVETANPDMGSICQIGIARFVDGQLTEEWSTLLDPEDRFDRNHISIHGIKPEMVKGEPIFPQIAERLRDTLEKTVTVCHMPFDRIAISRAYSKYSLIPISTFWLDSAEVVRRTWNELTQSGYGLSDVCAKIGYKFKHHDALEDAKAAGYVLLAALRESKLDLETWKSRVSQPIPAEAIAQSRRAMTNSFARRGASNTNEVKHSLSALLGIAQGVLCDGHLSNQEIQFLDDWLATNEAIATSWPGDVVRARIRSVIADGVITEAERAHLSLTLQQLIGGTLDELAASPRVTQLAFDDVRRLQIPGSSFCLTGDFVYGSRDACVSAIEQRGGTTTNVTRKLRYLVVGGLGSEEWKHGSFGTKLEKAIRYKREGTGILIVHEDSWVASL